MSIAYPEGECFFKRSALKSKSFSADDQKDFESHMLVEYLWNQPAYFGQNIPQYGHPRGPISKRFWTGDPFIGYWEQLPVMYGPRYDNIKRYYRHNLCTSEARLRARVSGTTTASAEAWFMVVPMPTEEERCIWIDCLACIRGIYIPVAREADTQYKDLCTYLSVNFTRKGASTQFWDVKRSVFDSFSCDKLFGLGVKKDWTIGLDTRSISLLLGLPRSLRNANVYTSKIVFFVQCKYIRQNGQASYTLSPNGQLSDSNDISWTALTNASTGLELQWRPYIAKVTNNWVGDTIKNMITAGLGYIPVVGLISQIAFSLAWTGLTDYKSFIVTLTECLPYLSVLTPAIQEGLRKDTTEMKSYLPPGWAQVGSPLQKIGTQTVPGEGELMGADPDAPLTDPDGTPQAALFVKGTKVLEKSINIQPTDPLPPPDDESPENA